MVLFSKKKNLSKVKIDIDDIARRMGAKAKGEVEAGAGYFGALQLAAQVETRFRTPKYGGWVSDPTMTELRNIRLKPDTLKKLEE